MDVKSIKELIRKFIVQLAKKKEHANVNDDDDVITMGIIDSLGIMQLVAYIEETFSIKVNDEDIIPDNFESIEVISSFIESKQ
ncbi:acyl carrier protein [bacterium]|nr:acyl carrier protein [bacterium]